MKNTFDWSDEFQLINTFLINIGAGFGLVKL